MTNYSFSDASGNSICEGYPTDNPRRFARKWLASHPTHECVEYWETRDTDGVGEDGESQIVWQK